MGRNVYFNFRKLFLAGFVIFGLYCCEKDDEQTKSRSKMLNSKLLLETETIDVPSSGGEYTIEVQSNFPWQVETNSEWIALSETNGKKGIEHEYFSLKEK